MKIAADVITEITSAAIFIEHELAYRLLPDWHIARHEYLHNRPASQIGH